MITAERLKELIKQRGAVYYFEDRINLNDNCEIMGDCELRVKVNKKVYGVDGQHFPLSALREIPATTVEQVMQEYDIENAEELDHILADFKQNSDNRYIWKRACYLACEKLGGELENTLSQYYTMDRQELVKHFFTEAQKGN